ncbi:MAG: DNA polymerase [Candidatus Hodarchaeota archaeon]
MNNLEKIYHDILLPLNNVLLKVNNQGLLIDVDYLNEMTKWYESELIATEKKIFDILGFEFNLNSHPQMREVLFKKLKLPYIRTTAGVSKRQDMNPEVLELLNNSDTPEMFKKNVKHLSKDTPDNITPSTDMYTRKLLAEMYDIPVIQLLTYYVKIYKEYSTYVKDYLEKNALFIDGEWRVYPSYRAIASSGRLRGANPNPQTYPRSSKFLPKPFNDIERPFQIRKMIIPPPGMKWIKADYSQMEFRGAAYISQDKTMLDIFENKRDPYKAFASYSMKKSIEEITDDERHGGKTISLALIYFSYSKTVQETLLKDYDFFTTIKQCDKFREDFTTLYNGYYKHGQRLEQFVNINHYVDSLYGRRRWFPPNVKSNVMSEAANHEVQASTTGDMSNEKTILLDKWLTSTYNNKAFIYLLAHDEWGIVANEDLCNEIFDKTKILLEAPPSIADWHIPAEGEIKGSFGG